MADTLDRGAVEKAYARWAPVYDLVFGKVFERGRRASIAAAERVGGRILEVGVGTGISLPDYARTNRLVGIDISAPMLRKAQERVAEHGLTNVEALAVMDAKHLAFPDDAFDVIVAQYVITAVPDPEATLDEFARVLKPGGEIVLVNHIGAESGAAQGVRAGVRAGRAPARLASGVSVGTTDRVDGPRARHPLHRAQADAAARAFFTDPLRQEQWRRAASLKEAHMNEDAFNMSVRKFLKKVGVTAQREIEQAVRDAEAAGKLKGGALPAKATFTIGGVNLTFDVTGEIETA